MGNPDEQLLASYLHNDSAISKSISIAQFKHRRELIENWSIPTGSNILEIGCGQGECSLVLADTIGPQGTVTAIDTASPSYGTPCTLGQSQDYIKNSQLGKRITFQQIDTANLLKSPTRPQLDGAVLCHSLWYFSSKESIRSLFEAIAASKTQRLYIAEYAFQVSLPAQKPHLLAAQTQKRLSELQTPQPYLRDHERNIRSAVSPQEVTELACGEGWIVKRQGTITPIAETKDGYWESLYVFSDQFIKAVESEVDDEAGRVELRGLIEQVRKAVEESEGGIESVRTMDVWWVEFSLGSEGK
jgi:SAM-dependent methyltransferase